MIPEDNTSFMVGSDFILAFLPLLKRISMDWTAIPLVQLARIIHDPA